VTAWAYESAPDDLYSLDLLVWLVLAHEADERGTVILDSYQLADRTRLCRRSVFRCLNRLRERGMVEWEHIHGHHTPTTFHIKRSAAYAAD